MEQDVLIAIDLGSTHLTAVAASMTPQGALHLLAVEESKVRVVNRGVILNTSSASYEMNKMLKLLKNRLRSTQEITSAFVTIGGRGMKIVELDISHQFQATKRVTPQLIGEMNQECRMQVELQNEGVCVLDVLPNYYVLSGRGRVDNIMDERVSHLKANYSVVVGLPTLKSGIEGCFDRSGVMIEQYALKMDAEAVALLSEQEREGGVAVIDLGGGTTMLSVYVNGALVDLHVVPLGAENITRDIQYASISDAYAEKLKTKMGYAMVSQVPKIQKINVPNVDPEKGMVSVKNTDLAGIIEARLNEMLRPIFERLKECEYDLPHGIVLTGGGALLKGVAEYVEQATGLSTSIGSHKEWLAEGTEQEYEAPNYSQVVGMLAIGAQYRKENVKPEKVKEPKVPRHRFIDKITGAIGDMVVDLFTEQN